MRIAIIHDYLNQFGGAERVVLALHELFPDAPIFTSIFDRSKMPPEFMKMDIRTSFMQNIPGIFKYFRHYFFLYPLAFRGFDLNGYDVVISSSSAFAQGIKTTKDQLHVCYCHTPARFLWDFDEYIEKEELGWVKKNILRVVHPILKQNDLETSKRVDFFIANSKITSNRIKTFYGRESQIIYPPVNTNYFTPGDFQEEYFLAVGRMVTYKRYDLVIEVFNELNLPLKIIGTGPAITSYKKMAGGNIEFLGKIGDNELRKYFAGCRALIWPEKSDLGLVPLEASASGRPSIAFGGGGAGETVIEGLNGVVFHEQSKDALKTALKRFKCMEFDKQAICEHAKKFDAKIFKTKMRDLIEDITDEN